MNTHYAAGKGLRGRDLLPLLARRPEFARLPPPVVSFFRDYVRNEKALPFGNGHVLSSIFPPIPSLAFDRFAARLATVSPSTVMGIGTGGRGYGEPGGESAALFSVTLAVTNRCGFQCSHCYNADRNQEDTPLEVLRETAARLEEMGAVRVHLTGGEPLLRADLEEIAGAFGPGVCVTVGTTGEGLTPDRARRLAGAGVFGMGISLDSREEAEHDRLRGRDGAFRIALDGLTSVVAAGLYPYVVTVASPSLLQEEAFHDFLGFVKQAGAMEVHLLEPCPVGRLASTPGAALSREDHERVLELHREVAADLDAPILATFAQLESAEHFGCGAGGVQLYIDGSGEVCPCQFVPLSFGNVQSEGLPDILARMGEFFRVSRTECLGHALNRLVPDDAALPLPPDRSIDLCRSHLPSEHSVPRFVAAQAEASGARVGNPELERVYDAVHESYDHAWLSEAAGPVNDLVTRIPWTDVRKVFEAGCGTGYSTGRVTGVLPEDGQIVAVDLSEGMLSVARTRLAGMSAAVQFRHGDALVEIGQGGPWNVVITCWVLGYIPLDPFFSAVADNLVPGGHLLFLVHQANSPREPMEIFTRLAMERSEALSRQVAFDFPEGVNDTRGRLEAAGLEIEDLWEDALTFRCASAQAALDHLMESGAGTAYYEAVRPELREELSRDFVRELALLHPGGPIDVIHDYVGCIARKRVGRPD
ncbi:MAG: radical SAM protein [Lentisphaerae bacterium]|nr:radical SAM protein [Lentisphaerota bacterium]